MKARRRVKQSQSLKDRLAEFANEARARAAELTPGLTQDDLLRKARQADTAANIDAWINSPGLRPPTE